MITRRAKRQPAVHMLASEFSESTLHEKGSGEYDPSYIITKLGAKVNRVVVSGMLERLEPRETSNGATIWQGQLRDPSGLHYFSVGDYESESMRELVIDASKKLESGDTLMMLMVAKARFFQNDEGAIYTSIRPEEGAIIGPSRYRQWLYEACKQTLTRISNHQKAYSCEANAEAYAESGIEREWINGLLLSRGHYEMVDIEQYKFNLLRALDIIENRPIEDSPQPVLKLSTDEQDQDGDASSSANGEDSLRETVLQLIDSLDKGEGVDFDAILSNAAARGFSRDAAEEVLDELSEEGILHEPRFGWFKRT